LITALFNLLFSYKLTRVRMCDEAPIHYTYGVNFLDSVLS